MLVCRSVHKQFKSQNKGNPKVTIRSFTFRFDDQGFYAIVGPSGSGKSTLVSLLGGLLRPTSGEISLNGTEMTSLRGRTLRRFRSEHFSFCFQESNLVAFETVDENVIPYSRLKGEDLRALFDELRLSPLRGQKAGTLSGGEAQRVALARAVLSGAEVLLCDEPTGSLDPGSSDAVFSLLSAIAKKRLVIVVTHDEERASGYADFLLRLEGGRLVSARPNAAKRESGSRFSLDGISASKRAPKLPARTFFREVFHSLLSFPVRLVSSLLVSSLSLAPFILASSLAIRDERSFLADSLLENGVSTVSVSLEENPETPSLSNPVSFDPGLVSGNIGNPVPIFGNGVSPAFSISSSLIESKPSSLLEQAAISAGGRLLEIDGEVLAARGWSLLAGRLPEKDGEAAISEPLFRLYEQKGFQNGSSFLPAGSFDAETFVEHAPAIEVSSPYFPFEEARVVGIVSLSSDDDFLASLSLDEAVYDAETDAEERQRISSAVASVGSGPYFSLMTRKGSVVFRLPSSIGGNGDISRIVHLSVGGGDDVLSSGLHKEDGGAYFYSDRGGIALPMSSFLGLYGSEPLSGSYPDVRFLSPDGSLSDLGPLPEGLKNVSSFLESGMRIAARLAAVLYVEENGFLSEDGASFEDSLRETAAEMAPRLGVDDPSVYASEDVLASFYAYALSTPTGMNGPFLYESNPYGPSGEELLRSFLREAFSSLPEEEAVVRVDDLLYGRFEAAFPVAGFLEEAASGKLLSASLDASSYDAFLRSFVPGTATNAVFGSLPSSRSGLLSFLSRGGESFGGAAKTAFHGPVFDSFAYASGAFGGMIAFFLSLGGAFGLLGAAFYLNISLSSAHASRRDDAVKLALGLGPISLSFRRFAELISLLIPSFVLGLTAALVACPFLNAYLASSYGALLSYFSLSFLGALIPLSAFLLLMLALAFLSSLESRQAKLLPLLKGN